MQNKVESTMKKPRLNQTNKYELLLSIWTVFKNFIYGNCLYVNILFIVEALLNEKIVFSYFVIGYPLADPTG